MSNYEQKQEQRRQRYQELADKAEQRSQQAYEQSSRAVEGIPFGQPILTGHHSEKRHRRSLEKSWNAMDKSVEQQKKTEYYQQKADSVGKGGISSDDEKAIALLKDKLQACEQRQTFMKEANKHVRRAAKLEDKQKAIAQLEQALIDLGKSEIAQTLATELLTFDFCNQIGFPDYEMKNNNAEIRRLKKRIAELEVKQELETFEEQHGEITYREDVEENRVMLIFPGKPDESTRKLLKKWGFRWSRTNEAWQRHLNGTGRFAAQQVLAAIAKE